MLWKNEKNRVNVSLLHNMHCLAWASLWGIVADTFVKALSYCFSSPKETIFCQPAFWIRPPAAWEEGLSGAVVRVNSRSGITLWGKLDATTEATFKSVFNKRRNWHKFSSGIFQILRFAWLSHTHKFPTVARVSFSLGAARTWILPFSWFRHHRTKPRKSSPWATFEFEVPAPWTVWGRHW